VCLSFFFHLILTFFFSFFSSSPLLSLSLSFFLHFSCFLLLPLCLYHFLFRHQHSNLPSPQVGTPKAIGHLPSTKHNMQELDWRGNTQVQLS
jgi:hypothetical protein